MTTTAGAVAIANNTKADDAHLEALHAEWEHICQAVRKSYDEVDDAAKAMPNWASKRRRQIARYECILLTNNLPEQSYEAARRHIDELTTPEYRSAHAPLEAAEQHQDDIIEARQTIEAQITDAPARTIAGVLCKLRVAGYWIRMQHSNRDGVLDKHVPTEGCLALAAVELVRRFYPRIR
jgi:hypothetical protein